MHDYDDNEDDQELVSKSALKRHMTYLQDLGESLLELSDKQLAGFPLEEELSRAIATARTIKSREGLRRHKQYMGKVMRRVDYEAIEKALTNLRAAHDRKVNEFHKLEQLRDQLVSDGVNAIEAVMAYLPLADRQQLRQLARQIRSDTPTEKRTTIGRKIFRYLKEVSEIN